MTATLVDSNVLLDIATQDETWYEWSARALASAADEGPLVINAIIYAEVSIGFGSIEELDDALPPEIFAREPLPYEAAFLAGKAFIAYRRVAESGHCRCRISTSARMRRSTAIPF